MNRHKRLSEISKQLGKHTNTIAKWCDAIETSGIHQFERVNGERVFNDRDQHVAEYVNMKRDEKWSMQQIIQQMQLDLDLHTHVLHMAQQLKTPDAPEAEVIKKEIIDALQQSIDRAVEIQVQQIKEQYERMMAALPKPQDETERQMAMISALLQKEEMEDDLRQEAITKWQQESDRKKRSFFFFWAEDIEKREKYIRNYVKEQMREKTSVFPREIES